MNMSLSTSTEKPVKLFSANAIILATLLGSFASGMGLIGINCMRLNKPTQARVAFWLVVLFLVALVAVLFFVPDRIIDAIPTSVLLLGQLLLLLPLYAVWAKRLFVPMLTSGKALVAPIWQAIVFVVLVSVLLFGLLVAAAYFGAFPPFDGERFRFGAFGHEVYHLDVSEDQAQEIAVALDELGHFDFFNFPIYFQIKKENDRLQLVFPYDDRAVLTNTEVRDYFINLKMALKRDYQIEADIILLYEDFTDSAFQKI